MTLAAAAAHLPTRIMSASTAALAVDNTIPLCAVYKGVGREVMAPAAAAAHMPKHLASLFPALILLCLRTLV